MYLKSLGSVSSRADFCASRSLHLLDSPLPDPFYPWEFRTSFALSVWQDTEKVQEGSERGRESKKRKNSMGATKIRREKQKKKFGWLCAGFLEKCWVLDPESPAFQLVKCVIVVEAQLPKMSPLMIAILSFVVSMAGEESLKVGSLISLPDSDN